MTAPHPALPLAALGLIAALVLLQSRRIGSGVYAFGRSDTAHDFQGLVFRLVGLALSGFFLARLIHPAIDGQAGPIVWLSAAQIAWAGLALLVLGAGIVVIGQRQMGRSWRVGIGREPTELVTGGLFSHSRNPVFLGFLLVLLGAFLTAANALTAAAFVVGWAAMATQIRLEESHLTTAHGADYQDYRAQVRRWL